MADISLYSLKADQLEPRTLAEQIRDAFFLAGLEPPPGPIQTDGRIHRFSVGDKNDDAGWYLIHGDGIPAGVIGNWKTGETHNFRAEMPRPLTVAEEFAVKARIESARKQREEELKKRHEKAAETVASIWDEALPASAGHPYLQKKGVQPHGARVGSDGRLMLPLYNPAGELSSLQYIDATGRKLYHAGGAVGSCYYMMGDTSGSETIYIAEGFATAATICETMQAATVAAYSANNLPAVAETLRKQYPAAELVIVADNDKSKAGENYATQASAKSGARVVLIPNEEQDANDFVKDGGDLVALLRPQDNAGIKALDIIHSCDITDEYVAPDEIIQGLFVAREVSVLYGASNSGKTFLSVAMADAVSRGADFMGLHTDKSEVLYIAAESPQSIKVRLQAIRKHFLRPVDGIHIAQAPVNLYSRPDYAASIVSAAEELGGVRFIIFDTLARITAGANENSGEDMAPIMETLDIIAKKTGAAVVVIHHSGKDQTRGSRGWSGIYGTIDAEVEVREDGGKRAFRVSKQRQLGSKDKIIGFDLQVVEMGQNKWGETSSTCVVVPADVDELDKLESEKSTFIDCCTHLGQIDYIEEKPYISTAALARVLFELGFAKSETAAKQQSKPSAKGYLCNKLKTAGLIKHHGSGYLVLDPDMAAFIEIGIKGISVGIKGIK